MIDWYLLLSPFLLLPIALLLVFVGCGLPESGDCANCFVKFQLTDQQSNMSTPPVDNSTGGVGANLTVNSTDTVSVTVSAGRTANGSVSIQQSPDGTTWLQQPLLTIPISTNGGNCNMCQSIPNLNSLGTPLYLRANDESGDISGTIELIIQPVTPPPPSGYNWNGTQCVPSTSGMGTYATLAACQAAHPSPPPPQLGPPIQTVRGTATSGSTVSVTLLHGPTDGNLLILTASTINGNGPSHLTISGISQVGVSWSKQVSSAYASPTPYVDVSIWAGVVGSGASTLITVTLSGPISSSGGAAIVNVCEFSGLLTSGFLDQIATNNSGSGTNASTGSTGTTSQANELLIGVVAAWMSSSVAQSSPTNSFTLVDGVSLAANGDDSSNAFLYQIVSSQGTYSTGTTIAISAWWAACIATFKGA